MKAKVVISIAVFTFVWLAGPAHLNAACCVAPADPTGGLPFPAPGCTYDHVDELWRIIDGLPPGTEIGIHAPLENIKVLQQGPGGSLGGEVIVFSALLPLNMTGTGELAGYNRMTGLPIQGEIHTGPRNPGDAVQTFDTDMFLMQGQVTGDPDFDLLRITAGTGFGMPSPGHTTLTRLSDTQYQVDSFFDITYRIDFVGAPGSVLGGMSGSTTGTIRLDTCPKQPSGDNCYEPTGASLSFADTPIPADFFDPGSEPFTGEIRLKGADPIGPDVIVRRLEPLTVPNIGDTQTIPIEMVQLNLVSVQPITVNVPGTAPQQWNLRIREWPTLPSPGHTTLTRTDADGGFMVDSFFDVWTELTFENLRGDTRVLGPFPMPLVLTQPVRWQQASPKPNPPCDSEGLYPVEELVLQPANGGLSLTLRPPLPVSPYFALDSRESWQGALDEQIAHVDSPGWQDYMSQWEQFLAEGEPYPQHTFMPADLYVWPDPDKPCPDPAWPRQPGLVMAWGDPQSADNKTSQSSAWRYSYPEDPDLSGATITITVLPPCWINVVSFGMQDIGGNIRSWYWNVGAAPGPGMLQCGVPTTISINAAGLGVGATTPPAASFANNPAFDITKVQDFIVDENGTWVGGPQPVPPPGQPLPRLWNYWYNLIVTPGQSIKPTDPVKWSQPPVEIGPHIFLGWDEVSLRHKPPLLADDWLCEDRRPVTDIHWWGSFIGWSRPELPPVRPIGFHFGIWTDVPKSPTDPASFSHPGQLIWDYFCNDFQWNFAGFDKDPRVRDAINDVAGAGLFQPVVRDSCFQFYCRLPQDRWFRQKPRANLKGRVHWLSIAAVYDQNLGDPRYLWGWKTRPHFFNDDAVRIIQLEDGSWPPTGGAAGIRPKWLTGIPLEYPRGLSWDLAFELTTSEPEPTVPVLDLDLNGIVDLGDFRFFAEQWLTAWPVASDDPGTSN